MGKVLWWQRELFRIANRTSGHFKGLSAFSCIPFHRRMSAQSDSRALLDSAEETLALRNDMDFSEYRRQIGGCFNLQPGFRFLLQMPLSRSRSLSPYSFRAEEICRLVIGWKCRGQQWSLSRGTNTCEYRADVFRILKLKPRAFVRTHRCCFYIYM